MSCPFLAKKISPPSTTNVDIDHVIQGIVDSLGLSNVDIAPYVQVLRDNWIVNSQQLFQLDPTMLARLHLPLGLESELVSLIRENNVGQFDSHHDHPPLQRAPSSDSVSLTSSDSPPSSTRVSNPNSRSALLGLSPEDRTLIKNSWKMLTDAKSTNGKSELERFFEYGFMFLEALTSACSTRNF